MKNLLKKLSLTSLLCHYKYYLTSQLVLKKTEQKSPRVKLATACYIDRDLYWCTSREYVNTSLLELKNIIRAEKTQLPPMPGAFFWQINKLSKDLIQVSYYVIPPEVMAAIPKECRVVIPLRKIASEQAELPLTIAHNEQNENDISSLEPLNWLEIIGFFSKDKQEEVKEYLTNKALVISLVSLFIAAALFLSAYSVIAINSYQNKKQDNEALVNEILIKKQNLGERENMISSLIDFLHENPNSLKKLSKLSIDSENVFLQRVQVITTGVQLSGTTKISATTLLKEIINSEPVKEAKFSRPVTKNHNGDEVFAIEVTWQ